MKVYLTFGQTHTHRVNGFTYDKDVICEIEAFNEEEARKIAFDYFGDKWFTTYTKIPELDFFPRGVNKLN